ncbi:hypothetical protein GQX73_g2937 [Xylaria multiplex]|uniref:Spindle pole body component n=1 Tax=Xylaria multiplex TaxID=323545 RepID=A0A7C8IYC1_9PEZI|nr:hypothetical protein GQX73_g2937 [Xylaria multiplex]
MASGHNDPKLLYAIQGVSAYHLAYGREESLTPGGPQTLSLLMVPTSSPFADPSTFDTQGDAPAEDFYLHLHLPPELDIPLPATTQIYHQPPRSYLIPRWDLGPDSGAFTRLEFPTVGARPGLQEDVDTFETILAQCTAFLERAPPPKTARMRQEKSPPSAPATVKNSSASTSKSKSNSLAEEQLPIYNPASYKPGEGYVKGSHSSAHGGQIVLIDEEDGSVIGELSEGFQVVESGVKPGSKDPVEITLPTEGNQLAVVPASAETIEMELHPAYQKSFIVSKAAYASRLIITTSDLVSNAMQSGSDSFTKSTKPTTKPMTFNSATHERVRRIGKFSGGVAEMSSKTVGRVTEVAQNLGAHLAGRGYKGKKGASSSSSPPLFFSAMLHEILLSLSGHPSPLLRNDHSDPTASSLISPPERQLLDTAARLSDLHCILREQTGIISAAHPSAICRAVSTAIVSIHLASFQRKIIEVEDSILRRDAALVGAYNIVPLTAVIGQFSGWTRRLEWLWELIEFMTADRGREDILPCQAAKLINRLRDELQTGYADIYETARSLLQVAETTWLKQVSAWVIYGRRPTVGGYDFFVREDEEDQEYKIDYEFLPSFVTPSAGASMLFIGTSINRARSEAGADLGANSLSHLSSQHQELAQLSSPLNSVIFSRAITSIRYTLSRTTLQKLLPLARADEKVRSRWRRADNLAYENRETLGTVVIKEGEVSAVLARTWAFLGSMQSEHADDDEALELARDLLRLHVSKSIEAATPAKGSDYATNRILDSIAPTPFRNLLFSVPVTLTMQIQSPLDLFLTHSDLQIYTAINSYLLSIRRAHLRLTDLWKITSLRRHHPPPPRSPYGNTKSGISKTKLLRERASLRSSIMRSTWSTSSAAIFFLGETEAYLQVAVVEGLWSHFHGWLTGTRESTRGESNRVLMSPGTSPGGVDPSNNTRLDGDESSAPCQDAQPNHDPQSLSAAHRQYLGALTRRLLLTQPAFTTPLYDLLIQIDHLVALVHRLHSVWVSADLEADEGVVDAFSNLDAEERDVRAQLRGVERRVKFGIEDVISALRTLSLDSGFAAEMEGEEDTLEDEIDEDEVEMYRPQRVGGIDRLLMKLDFGGWFGPPVADGGAHTQDDDYFS